MKRLLILSALFFVAVMVSMLVAFPNMLNIIEYNSYFSGDSAFFKKKWNVMISCVGCVTLHVNLGLSVCHTK